MTDSCSNAARADGLNWCIRDSTRSATRLGTSSGPAANASLTKNGLPPVIVCSAPGARPVPAASTETACGLSGCNATR